MCFIFNYTCSKNQSVEPVHEGLIKIIILFGNFCSPITTKQCFDFFQILIFMDRSVSPYLGSNGPQESWKSALSWRKGPNHIKFSISSDLIMLFMDTEDPNLYFVHSLSSKYWISVSYFTAQKTEFSIKNFFSKCDQIRRKLIGFGHIYWRNP